jgi:hypothetical protein
MGKTYSIIDCMPEATEKYALARRATEKRVIRTWTDGED